MAQEYYVGVIWDSSAKKPVVIFSDMGGIDIEEVAETHPEHVSKTHFSSILPLTPRIAKEAVGATGVTGSDLNKLAPIVFNLMKIFLKYDLTLAEINPLAKLEDGRFIVLDGHIDMEAEARGEHKAFLDELGIDDGETRLARPPTADEAFRPDTRVRTDWAAKALASARCTLQLLHLAHADGGPVRAAARRRQRRGGRRVDGAALLRERLHEARFGLVHVGRVEYVRCFESGRVLSLQLGQRGLHLANISCNFSFKLVNISRSIKRSRIQPTSRNALLVLLA